MTLSWSGATAYWTPTGGTPIVSGSVFSNALLPQTIYLEGDGCGMNEAVFSVVGLSDCKTNAALNVFGMNATLDGVAELEELAPGGFIADCSVHADAIRSQLSLEACGPYGAPGNVVLSWSPSLVQLYPSATGGSPLSQYIVPYAGFTGATFYVEGVAPGSTTLGWTYSEQSDCADEIKVTILKVEFKTNELIRPLHEQTLDAETWLTDDTVDKTRITWTITKVEGVTATIDQDGDITYGQGSGIYTIRAESSDLST